MELKANTIKSKIEKTFVAASHAARVLKSCHLCGHRCGVDRTSGEKGICGAGMGIGVASYTAHHGEEPFISGEGGSGAVFFSQCTMKCEYCQNWEISQTPSHCLPLAKGEASRSDRGGELADIMLDLQRQGCHNINLVTPTHYMPQILQELKIALEKGLEIPVVYNTNGYDSLELLKILDGIIDVYMPDFKYFDDEKAKKYSNAENYVETAKAGIKEMYRQVGIMRFDENDIAVRGLLVRHLVLPNSISDSNKVLKYLSTVSKEVWISIMSQYSPQNRAGEFQELNRSLLPEEYWGVVGLAQELKLENYLIQEMSSADVFLPDFEKEKPFV